MHTTENRTGYTYSSTLNFHKGNTITLVTVWWLAGVFLTVAHNTQSWPMLHSHFKVTHAPSLRNPLALSLTRSTQLSLSLSCIISGQVHPALSLSLALSLARSTQLSLSLALSLARSTQLSLSLSLALSLARSTQLSLSLSCKDD